MSLRTVFLRVCVLLAAGISMLTCLAAAPLPTIASKTEGMQRIDGYFPMYWDAAGGKLWLEIGRWDKEFLYMSSLAVGVGSNDLGLDRGLIPGAHVVSFERTGPRVLLIESNYRFRASSPNPMERRTVEESFARSVLWGFDAAAEENGRVLVDASGFFLHDDLGVAKTLTAMKQGSYHLDPSRCAFYLPRTRGFPKNSEVESTLTFTGEATGRYVRDVVPTPDAISIREHYSLVALPGAGYTPREGDPRAGYFMVTYRDYSTPLGEPVDKHLIARHRLIKKDPGAAVSEPVTPIVYYVDGGAPEDVRKALMEGASWWEQAFEAAGFRNAFQVKVLPPDADPMDIRYNVIQWVHRFTRGWSYGNAITDPRTGEIMKGQVTLGSLRYRQDYLVFSSLLAPFGPGQPPPELKDAVYARLRQLAAHETGHTLGLEHNFAASAHHNASVMDYPHARVQLAADGSIDLAHAYSTNIGAWDKVAIRYGYTQFAPVMDEKKALDSLLVNAAREGNILITDADSRPVGSAHPRAHLWDNGPNAVDELQRLLKVRQAALARFGENNIQKGAPMSTLDEMLVPLYYMHRYQTEAAAKELGGLDYTYALRGDGQLITKVVAPAEQRRALKALLETISPATLTLPARILALIPPHPPGYPRTAESFPNRTGVTFDPVAGAEAAADLTVSLILNPQRDARLVQYHAMEQANPGLEEVIQALIDATFHDRQQPGLDGIVSETVASVVAMRLISLASDATASPAVRSLAQGYVLTLSSDSAVPLQTREMLKQYLSDPQLSG